MFVATMESESFNWMAAGDTEDEARAALAAGWEKTLRLSPGFRVFADYSDPDAGVALDGVHALDWYEPTIIEIAAGQCARDGDVIS